MKATPKIGPFQEITPAERRQSMRDTLAAKPVPGPLRIFGYGSLMWSPCFDFVRSEPAALADHARRMCVWTALARGTPDAPGLALGLTEEPGAHCHGLFFELKPRADETDLSELWAREMHTAIYRPRWVEVETSAASYSALTFVVNTGNEQYAGAMTTAGAAEYIRSAAGKFGSNRDYLSQSIDALGALGITDPELLHLQQAVEGD